jgi:predicted transposase YdaD
MKLFFNYRKSGFIKEGRKEGRKDGKKDGRKEGRKDGRKKRSAIPPFPRPLL